MKRAWCFLLVLTGTLAIRGASDGRGSWRIDTLAGSGRMGDGGPATMAQIGAIQGIAVDRAGNLYLSDTDHHRVRKVSAAGVITTVAGTGAAGFSGDGGPAAAAQLNLPYGLAVDAAGSVYVADLGNQRVRRIDPTGVITTVAGGGSAAGEGVAATAAKLLAPRNVVADAAGNLYISEFEGHRIRRVTADGKISTAAGTGVAGAEGDGGPAANARLSAPAGLALDGSGALYVADSQNNRIRKIVPGGVISTVLGANDGIATPHAVALDPAGNVYVADAKASVTCAGADGRLAPFAGGAFRGFQGDGGPAAAAALSNTLDLAVDGLGNVYIADDVRVRKVDRQGIIQTVAGDGYSHAVGDGGSAVEAILRHPSAVALDASGNLFIADPGTQRVRQVLPSGTIATVAGTGAPVWGVTTGPVLASAAGLNDPMGVAADPLGNVFIADTANHVVRKVGADRVVVTAAGTGEAGTGPDSQAPNQMQLRGPQGVCFDRAGTLFVVDSSNHRVLRVPPGGLVTVVAGNGSPGDADEGVPARAAQLNQPTACAADSFGNLFIADTLNHRIRKVTAAGIIISVVGTADPGFAGDDGPAVQAQLRAPRGVAVDDSGDIFVADTGNHRIRQVMPDGVIRTIGGQGSAGFQGDGGAATAALMDSPGGLFLDGAGAVYFADTGNDRVRRLTPVSITGIADPLTSPGAISAVNAASQRSGPVAPGEIVLLSGSGLGPDAGVAAGFDSGMLPTQLAGVEVRFDGVSAPLFFVHSSQVDVQAPYDLTGRSKTHVEAWYQGRLAGTADLPVAPAAPGVYPVALQADGTANSAARPAAPGSVLTLYCTGEGLTDGANISGKTSQAPYAHPRLPVSARIGKLAAEVVDAISAPGVVGILQVTVRVPVASPSGQAGLQLSVGGVAAPDLAIWVQ